MAILLCKSDLDDTTTITYPVIDRIDEKIDEFKKEVNKIIRVQNKKSWIRRIRRRKR